MIASVVFGKDGHSFRSRAICDWSTYSCENLSLPELKQGRYQKTKSLVDDKDIRAACLALLRSQKADKNDSQLLMKWINSELKQACGLEYDITVSERTAINWLLKLNFNFEECKQGSAYVDGHE
jgi:hypothetical protein